MDRSKELRALMRTKSGTVDEGRERVRQLKAARAERQSQPVHQSGIKPGAVAAITAHLPADTEPADKPPQKPKMKISTASLTAAQVTAPKPAQSVSQFDYEIIDTTKQAELQPFHDAPDNETETVSLPAETATAIGKEIPSGFFDDPLEDMVARGLDVKQELLSKERRLQESLDTFFAEVETAAETAAAEEELNSDHGELAAFEEQALQLAYSTKAARFIAESERVYEGLLGKRDTATDNKDFEDIDVALDDVDAVISEHLSAKRDREEGGGDDILRDVVAALQSKRQRMMSVQATKSDSEEEYVPLDEADNWQARSLY